MSSESETWLRVVETFVDSSRKTLADAFSALPIPEALKDDVRRRFEERRNAPVARPAILSTPADRIDWVAALGDSTWYHWARLRQYLIDKRGRGSRAVDNLHLESSRVLSLLGDPRSGAGEFRIQGLVVGHVQSGKTANFTALAAKAGDAGYRLVIILAGIHNSLRRQTQERIHEEFGLSTGVPAADPGRGWMPLTTPSETGDFRPGTFGSTILEGSQPLVAVVKKNSAVLRRLNEWVGVAAPPGLPVLIIDDEADQASINTADMEESEHPSRINGLIRELLGRFRRVSYVAYTATPFANVFIDHEATGDLYPADFIVALDKPSTYVGAEELFGTTALAGVAERAGLDVIVQVDEGEASHVRPGKRKRDDDTLFVPTMPATLLAAIDDFVLAGGAFLTRSDLVQAATTPLSMLVHSHHTIDVQDQLGTLVSQYVDELKREWRHAREDRLLPRLRTRWETSFVPITRSIDASKTASFEAICPGIDALLLQLQTLIINSESDDKLVYRRSREHPDGDPGLKALVVGGNRLSRGLTLENLLVSYFVRDSPVLDTLLQMGRWFGHRRSYVDLTRLYTTPKLRDWFREVSAAEEELRDDIREYAAMGRTPRDFGPRVRSHPILRPTASNKMRQASKVACSFAGRLVNTLTFDFSNRDWLQSNLDATLAFLRGLGAPQDQSELVWRGIPASAVLAFLTRYRTVAETSFDVELVAEYVRTQNRQRELRVWDVKVVQRGDDALGDEEIAPTLKANCINRSKFRNSSSIGSLINPATLSNTSAGDELLGMSGQQLAAARELVDQRGLKWPSALRHARDPDRGVLLIYFIGARSEPGGSGDDRESLFPENLRDTMPSIAALAMVFPFSTSAGTTEYVVGTAGAVVDAE